MPSTYTTRFGFEQPGTGELQGLWGATVNTNITALIDEMIASASEIAMGDTNQTLTIPNAVSSPNRAAVFRATGACTAVRTLTLPAGTEVTLVMNATSGGFGLDVKTPSSSTVTIPNGYSASIVFVGANAYIVAPYYIGQAMIEANTSTPAFKVIQSGAGLAAEFDGAVQVDGIVKVADGTDDDPSISFVSDDDTGIYRVAADEVGVTTGGVLRLAISDVDIVATLPIQATQEVGITGAAASNRSLTFQTGGLDRWTILANGTAEGGSNAGSDFAILRHDDAGASIATAFSIERATGVADFATGYVGLGGGAGCRVSRSTQNAQLVAGTAGEAQIFSNNGAVGAILTTSGVLNCIQFAGSGGAGARLTSWGTTNSLSFDWASPGAGGGQLYYIVDGGAVSRVVPYASNATAFTYAGGSGGPTGVALNALGFAGDFFAIYVDALSDERVKTNIRPTVVDALQVVLSIPVRSFDIKPEVAKHIKGIGKDKDERKRIKDEKQDPAPVGIGFIAQEVKRLVPEAVNISPPHSNPDSPLPADAHTIIQQNLIPYLWRAVQQLSERVATLEANR